VNINQCFAVQLVAQQAPDGKGEAQPGMGNFLIPLIAMFAMFYFLVLRPNRRQEKDRQAMIDAIKKNDEVVTIGGIVGKIVNLRNDEVTLESSNSRLRILRSSIARVVTPSDKAESKESEADKDDSGSPDERIQKKD
jgi:preprotein translocase subunit YajC